MKRWIMFFIFCFISVLWYSQKVSNRIQFIFINISYFITQIINLWRHWWTFHWRVLETKNESKELFFVSAYIKSIPVNQRVIMISYLEEDQKFKAHQWIYNNLTSSQDTMEYFSILSTDYGISFYKLNIKENIVKKYCPGCNINE